MPICTYRNGVGLFVLAVALGVGLFSNVPVASAQTASSTKKYTTTTTKGVRTTTAYRKRRPPVKTGRVQSTKKYATKTTRKSYAYGKTTSVKLPKESADGGNNDIVQAARRYIGARYVYGGSSPRGFDCTGLIHHVFGDKAKNLPRSSAAMYQAITKVDELKPGDIVFFGRSRVHHAAIYAGNGKLIHASTPRTGVRSDDFATIARALGYRGAGRVI